jgi:hypothetical protein
MMMIIFSIGSLQGRQLFFIASAFIFIQKLSKTHRFNSYCSRRNTNNTTKENNNNQPETLFADDLGFLASDKQGYVFTKPPLVLLVPLAYWKRVLLLLLSSFLSIKHSRCGGIISRVEGLLFEDTRSWVH